MSKFRMNDCPELVSNWIKNATEQTYFRFGLVLFFGQYWKDCSVLPANPALGQFSSWPVWFSVSTIQSMSAGLFSSESPLSAMLYECLIEDTFITQWLDFFSSMNSLLSVESVKITWNLVKQKKKKFYSVSPCRAV